jgi:hypothetical protein
MLLYALYAIGAIIAGGLGFAATRPDTFRLQRSTRVNAVPDRIAANIDDFHLWNAWSPWEKLDPALERKFSGAPKGKGAIYEWQGNKKVGQGRMEITDITPTKVTIKLDFLAPWEAHNVTEFQLAPSEGGTQVTWSLEGPSDYKAKVFGLVFNMEKMVGGDFERGLAGLKKVSESSVSA